MEPPTVEQHTEEQVQLPAMFLRQRVLPAVEMLSDSRIHLLLHHRKGRFIQDQAALQPARADLHTQAVRIVAAVRHPIASQAVHLQHTAGQVAHHQAGQAAVHTADQVIAVPVIPVRLLQAAQVPPVQVEAGAVQEAHPIAQVAAAVLIQVDHQEAHLQDVLQEVHQEVHQVPVAEDKLTHL